MISRSEKNKKLDESLKKEEKAKKRQHIFYRVLKIIFLIMLIFIILTLYMHFVGTKGLEVREYKIESETLPESLHGFKIVHFSDLHYLTTIKEKEVGNLVDKINELKPDLVVFTGDLIDKEKIPTEKELEDLINNLNKIKATTGLYAIKGNHDYNNNYFEKVFSETEFIVLNNSYELVYYKGSTPILLTGVNSILENDCDINQTFSYENKDSLYTILLLHEPDVIDDIINNYKVDLALAGHSHNGQIRLPVIGAILSVEEGKKYPNKEYKINDTELYVSGGLGTSIYEFRFFNKPSINLYRLTTK